MLGAAALVVLVGVVVATLRTGERPEEAVADAFLVALLAGDADAAYRLTTPDYRSLVRPGDLAALAAGLRDVAGEGARTEVIGSERTPGAIPAESLVGYTGRTEVGPMEGVVTLVRLEAGGGWLVHDLSYRFPEAPPGELTELRRVTRDLNEALAERAGARGRATPGG